MYSDYSILIVCIRSFGAGAYEVRYVGISLGLIDRVYVDACVGIRTWYAYCFDLYGVGFGAAVSDVVYGVEVVYVFCEDISLYISGLVDLWGLFSDWLVYFLGEGCD